MKHGLDTLARLRGFEQARASLARARKARGELDADAARQSAQDNLSSLQQLRGASLQSAELDLGRLTELAAMETDAAHMVEARNEAFHQARKDHEVAIAAHHQARARLNAASAASERYWATERDHREKQEFDRVADLHASTKERER